MKRERLYIILALVTICFWGTTFVSTKILLGVLSPIHIMLCEQTGWCQNPGDRAVCLPNRTSLICYDKASL